MILLSLAFLDTLSERHLEEELLIRPKRTTFWQVSQDATRMEGVQINVLAETFYIKFGLDASHGTNNSGFIDGISECSREVDCS